jgi:hypothetical protein
MPTQRDADVPNQRVAEHSIITDDPDELRAALSRPA